MSERAQTPRSWRRLAALSGALAAAIIATAVSAAGAQAADSCPNADIRAQQGSERLPDCRAYELVSPAQKFGYSVGQNGEAAVHLGVSDDGRKVTYEGLYPLEAAEAGSGGGFLGERSSGGWMTVGLPKFHGPVTTGAGAPAAMDTRLLDSTPDQSVSVYWDCSTEPFGALWVRRGDGSRQMITAATGFDVSFQCRASSAVNGKPDFLGISPDGRHVVFNSTARLGPAVGIPGTNRILYEWVDDGAAGELRVVSRTNGEPVALVGTGHASLGAAPPTSTAASGSIAGSQKVRDAISDGSDGHSRIVFQSPAPASPTVRGGALYMRVDGVETIQLSAPAAGHTPVQPPTATGVSYIDASRDGTTVFFAANGDLTSDAPTAGGVYRYDADPDGDGPATSQLRWLAATTGSSVPSGLADDDGSHLYLSAGEDLVLILEGGEVKTVGPYSPRAGTMQYSPAAQRAAVLNNPGLRAGNCVSGDVSPDGRFLAWVARDPEASNAHQVFRYDAEADGGAGRVERISSVPSGPPADSYESVFIGDCSGGTQRNIEKRVMSDDGRTIFFSSGGALVPGDVNGPNGLDVYRWRDGEVQLVSSGAASARPDDGNIGYASFQGTDATGENAFFTAYDRLVPQDGDGGADVYNARVNGGFAMPVVESCDGDGCQGDLSSAPPLARPGSDGLGAGDESAVGGGLSLAAVTAGQRRALANRGRVRLRVRVGEAGRVSVSGRARVAGKRRVVLRGTGRARRAGTVTVVVRLSKVARKRLAGGKRLRVVVSARLGGETSRRTLALRRTK